MLPPLEEWATHWASLCFLVFQYLRRSAATASVNQWSVDATIGVYGAIARNDDNGDNKRGVDWRSCFFAFCMNVSMAGRTWLRRSFSAAASIQLPGDSWRSRRHRSPSAACRRTVGTPRSTRGSRAASLHEGGCRTERDWCGRSGRSCARSRRGRLQDARTPAEQRYHTSRPWHTAALTCQSCKDKP